MVLKWLGGGKLDHPLADEKGAREVFGALAHEEAAKAVEDVRHWVESVIATDGFKADRRAELILQLDEAAHPHQLKLARDYFSTPNLSKFQEARLWGALSALWSELAGAYATVLEQLAGDSASAGRLKAQLPLLVTRAVRACAAQVKWRCMHYEPGGPAVWEAFAKVYRFAEAKKIQRETVTPYARMNLTTSAEREFLKALMLAASSPDCLLPGDIDLAERIVAHLSESFVLGNAHRPQSTCNWIDLAAGTPPGRLTQTPPASPGLRFFAAGTANEKLDAMIKVAKGGAIPADLNLGSTCEVSRVLAVLRHLKANWAATPPVRKHDRYEVEHRLNVVNGFDGVHARVQDGAGGGPAEAWMTRNISSGGIGAAVGKAQGAWPGIGSLVGLSVEGGSGGCSVGMIRRASRGEQLELFVGLRTFAKTAVAVSLGGIEPPEALLLSNGGALTDDALICMREGGYDARVSPTMAFEGRNYLLVPLEKIEGGKDFEVARYRAMQQA